MSCLHALKRKHGKLSGKDYLPQAGLQESDVSLGPFEGPISIPSTRKAVYETFGNPGTGKIDPKWERANMVLARDLPLVRKGKLYVHKLAEPYLREALTRCEALSGYWPQRVGCFNFRHQRHDTSRPLSYHSWGIAVDIDPKLNRSHRYGTGGKPEPWSTGWLGNWENGLPREFVEAWESVGWFWGGRWNNYVDPMHFQLVI